MNEKEYEYTFYSQRDDKLFFNRTALIELNDGLIAEVPYKVGICHASKYFDKEFLLSDKIDGLRLREIAGDVVIVYE